jgi:hypothetical protein
MLQDNLAKVVLSYTGDWKKDEFLARVTAMFEHHAVPVRDSFKQLEGTRVVVGFVHATPDVRPADEEGKKYRVIATNVLMDTADSSTWEIKEGASGKYLVRNGMEDLSELAKGLSAHRADLPRVRNIAVSAGVAPQEFVAYVDGDEGEMAYGFAVARDNESNKIAVICSATNEVKEISEKLVVHATHLEGEEHKMANMELAANSDKGTMEAYYRKLYGYAPEYVNEIIKMINEHAFA